MTGHPLSAAREPVVPRRAQGLHRTLERRTIVTALGASDLVPRIRRDRGPSLRDDAVLAALARGRFHSVRVETRPHELRFVAGLLTMARLGLFLLTSAPRRV